MATSGIYTLEQLRTLSQQRADLENSEFITTSEWNNYVNDSIKELFDLQIQAYGNDYFCEYVTFTTDGTTQLYDLPDGENYSGADQFYKFLGLDLQLSNTNDSWVTIRNFSFQDRNRFAVPNFQSFYGITNLRYRLNGNKLWLTPVPMSGQTLRLWYIPRAITLTADADEFDGYGGWSEYVIIDAAIKAMVKQELDISALAAQKAAMYQRIESIAENRDAGNPARVTDAAFSDYIFPSGNNGNTGGFF